MPSTVCVPDSVIFAVVAATTLAFVSSPCATVSTYALVAASVSAEGVARLVILKLFMLTLPPKLPVPLATNAVVLKLPLVTLPVTAKLVSVPTEVILGCAAVVNVPTMLVPLRLPEVMLPVTANAPKVPTVVILVWLAVVSVPTILVPLRLPPVMLPVTVAIPLALILPKLALPVWLDVPVTLKLPPVVKLPPAIVPLAVIVVGVRAPVILMFPPLILPVAAIDPVVIMFPPVTLPDAVIPVVPSSVIAMLNLSFYPNIYLYAGVKMYNVELVGTVTEIPSLIVTGLIKIAFMSAATTEFAVIVLAVAIGPNTLIDP